TSSGKGVPRGRQGLSRNLGLLRRCEPCGAADARQAGQPQTSHGAAQRLLFAHEFRQVLHRRDRFHDSIPRFTEPQRNGKAVWSRSPYWSIAIHLGRHNADAWAVLSIASPNWRRDRSRQREKESTPTRI